MSLGMLGACIGQDYLQQQPGNWEDIKLDLVGVQGVRWDKGGTVRAGDYNFFYGKEMKTINWEGDFCTPQNSISS
jgi:hypothetical protein